MTQWTEQPLRKPGQPWPGINTKGGRLDNGTGQLTDRSVNVTINRQDVLAKRNGFVRGLNERFAEVVCGLHKYTDGCGREWLLVADTEGINIREPFVIPDFVQSDAYPIDDFHGDLDMAKWRGDGYASINDELRRTGPEPMQPFSRGTYLRWFKDAANQSYRVQVEYRFDPSGGNQLVSIAIKGNGDLTAGSYVHCDLLFRPTGMTASTYHVNAAGARSLQGSVVVAGSMANPGGFLTLTYTRFIDGSGVHGRVTAEVVPIGGASQTIEPNTNLSEGDDRNLGQVSAIGCSQQAVILQVSGGSA